MNLYKEEILDHYRFPRHRGTLLQPDFSCAQYNAACGDHISFQAKVANGTIAAIGFEGSGCVISQAAASMLAEFIVGKPLIVISELSSTTMIELIGIELGPTRLKCALLCLYAVQEGIQSYTKKG